MSHSEPDEAVARSVLYGLLARIFAYPLETSLAELHEVILPLSESIDGDAAIVAGLDGVALELRGAAIGDLQRRHERVFPPIESPDHPAYETAYRGEEIWRQAQLMADVAGFYRAHGLTVGGALRERPDHVSVELEFMGWMARKEAYAIGQEEAEHVAECRRTQASFLESHLGCWAPAFGRRIGATVADPLYRSAGALLAASIEADIAHFGVDVEERADTPLGPPDAPEETCESGCSLVELRQP